MKLKVVDQLHVSAVGPDTLGKGAEFEASKAMGDDLVKRGLATVVESEPEAEKAVEAKAEKAPLNKAIIAAPANKAAPKGKGKGK